jgi:hypothetical protein
MKPRWPRRILVFAVLAAAAALDPVEALRAE